MTCRYYVDVEVTGTLEQEKALPVLIQGAPEGAVLVLQGDNVIRLESRDALGTLAMMIDAFLAA